jgi:hypothetical protein
MQTGITNAPPTARPSEPFPQLIYTLDRWDYQAWWLYAGEKGQPSGARRSRLKMWVAVVLGLTLTVAGALALAGIVKAVRDDDYRLLTVFGTLFILMVGLLALLLLLRLWARLFGPQPPAGQRQGDNYQQRMQAHALELEQAGEVINRNRIHWFLISAEGFNEVSELRRVSPQGVVQYEYREDGGPWSLLDEVVLGERHVFLIRHGHGAWIIPRSCFADKETLERFLATVQSLRQAASRATAITAAPGHPEKAREISP